MELQAVCNECGEPVPNHKLGCSANFKNYAQWDYSKTREFLEKKASEMSDKTRNFDSFMSLVRDSVDGQAARKGYTANGADGDNALYRFTKEIGVSDGHSIGEMIYKLVEYVKEPREVILIKVAGWSFLMWKYFSTYECPTAGVHGAPK